MAISVGILVARDSEKTGSACSDARDPHDIWSPSATAWRPGTACDSRPYAPRHSRSFSRSCVLVLKPFPRWNGPGPFPPRTASCPPYLPAGFRRNQRSGHGAAVASGCPLSTIQVETAVPPSSPGTVDRLCTAPLTLKKLSPALRILSGWPRVWSINTPLST